MAANSRLIGSLVLLAALAPSCGSKSSSKSQGPVPGPATWYSQYRKPTSSNLRAIRAANQNSVIVAGDATSIFRSDDAGQTWNQIEHRPGSLGGDIVSMDFFGDHVVCVGTDSANTSQGRVWTSINGVLDFTTPVPAASAAYAAVDVVAIDTEYRLRTDGIVELSTGTPAVVANLPAMPAGTWRSIFFFANGDGYAAGDAGKVAKFTATLNSWSSQTVLPPAPGPPTNPQFNLNKIWFTDATHGYACGDQATILSTSDGGGTWAISNYISGGVVLNSLHFPVDSTTGWVVGKSGTINRTTNSGASWNGQFSPLGTGEDHNDVFFADNSNGYIVGTHGIVLRTTDGGVTWLRAPPLATADPLVQLNAVDFTSDGVIGVAVGNAGAVLWTLDGGSSWIPLSSPSSADFFGVSIPRTGSWDVAYLCGAGGAILKITSLQSAPTFATQTSGTGNDLHAILFPGGDTIGWACGDGATTILQTNSGGTSWTAPVATPAGTNWKALSADIPTNIYVAGDGGKVAVSSNFGASWSPLTLPTTPIIRSIQSPAGANALFAGANDTNVYEKFGALGWTSTALPSGSPLSLAFIDASNGWVVNDQTPFTGGVFYTGNGGGTWTHLYVHTKWQLRAIWMSPSIPGLGYVVGDNGTILKTTTGGT